MSVRIRETIAQILGTDTENIRENYGRYYVLLRLGKEAAVVRKELVFYVATYETDDEAYARLIRDRVEFTPDLTTVSTKELSAELSRREGVRTIVYGPEDSVYICGNDGVIINDNGPVTVIINVD
jgi:hypothetical protein